MAHRRGRRPAEDRAGGAAAAGGGAARGAGGGGAGPARDRRQRLRTGCGGWHLQPDAGAYLALRVECVSRM